MNAARASFSRFAFQTVLLLVLLGMLPAESPAEPLSPRQKAHAWARFGKGSWSNVRVTTEMLDERGQVTGVSVTETKTTVEQVAGDGVSLRIESICELAQKRFNTQTQVVKQGYAGESVGETVSVKSLGRETVTIEGQEIPCEKQQVEIIGDGHRLVSLTHFSDKVPPYVLKRNTVGSDLLNKTLNHEASTEVIVLDMPIRVFAEMRTAAYLKSVQRNDRGTTITLSVNCPDVPGEVVSNTSKKLDSEGRLLRRSTLELIGYRIEPSGETRGESDDKLVRRHRRSRASRR